MITIPSCHENLFYYCRFSPTIYHFAMKTFALNTLCIPDRLDTSSLTVQLYTGSIESEFVTDYCIAFAVCKRLGYQWLWNNGRYVILSPIWHLIYD